MPLDDIVQRPRRATNRAYDPRYSRAREMQSRADGGRRVKAALPYWFPLVVPFTSQVGQNISAIFNGKNFDLEMRAAWTDLVAPRVVLTDTSYGLVWSNDKVPLNSIAGRSTQTHPLMYLRRPYLLLANSVLRGDFIDDAGTEVAGQVVWVCERPDSEVTVSVGASREWYWEFDLGLTGGPTTTGRVTTQPVNEDVLIYGALSTSQTSQIRIIDNHTNIGWSDDKLPVGAFAGLTGQPSPVVWYPQPFFCPRNTSMIIEWLNAGSETGKFFTFICERIIRAGSQADNPTPVTPTPRIAPVTQPPTQQPPMPGPTITPELGPTYVPGPNVFPIAVVVLPIGTHMSDGSVTAQVMIVESWPDGSQTIRPREPWE